jgi:response regulator of citrate/malate metabolism
MSKETLVAIRAALLAMPEGLSATRAAEIIGASRVTARRYLDYLAESGGCDREPIYGRTGRPELVYRVRPAKDGAGPGAGPGPETSEPG